MQKGITRRMLVVAAVAAIMFAFYAAGWFGPATDAVAGVLARLAGPVYAAGVQARRSAAGLADPDNAVDGVTVRALEDLKIENAKLRALVTENESLKSALAFRERYDDVAVVARVISGSSDDAIRALVIDRGSEDGLRPDQPVIVGNGIIIGKTYDVRRRTSTVLLLSDSRSRLAVAVQNADDTLGVLEGDRGLSMSIGLIPQNASISPGDVIVTSGAEPGIRRGLVIGAVAKVAKNSQDPFQSADVQPFLVSSQPIFVQVLMPDAL